MEITRGRSTYTGVKEVDGNIVCEKCGRSDKCKMVMHMDSKDFYSTTYQCDCGNMIGTRAKRSKEESAYWG